MEDDASAQMDAECTARVELVAVYRTLDRMGMNEGICNHLTALVPGTTDQFLCIRYGQDWSEVTPESLVLLDATGRILKGEGPVETTAFQIHRALHASDPERNAAVLHTHMPYTTALCCTDPMRLEMIHQNSCRFHGAIAYDEIFNGLVDSAHEGERLANAMRGRSVLLHRSHGVMVCGPSIARAFDDLYYLERAAMAQVMALQTSLPLSLISDTKAAAVKAQFEADYAANDPATQHLAARLRILYKEDAAVTRLERIEAFSQAAVGASYAVWMLAMITGAVMGGRRAVAYFRR